MLSMELLPKIVYEMSHRTSCLPPLLGYAQLTATLRLCSFRRPTIVRASSPLLSLLTSYLQCLYAVPTFRHEILAFRPTQKQLGSMHNFGGYWRGDENVETPRGDGLPEDHPYWGTLNRLLH